MRRRNTTIGHIADSRFWLSIERPSPYALWSFRWGRTYNGTRWGVVVLTPWFTLLSHWRPIPRLRESPHRQEVA